MKEIKTNDERRSILFLLLRKGVWVFILFLNIQTFSQIYNDGKNTILYGSENIVEKATISPTISENSSIYISENSFSTFLHYQTITLQSDALLFLHACCARWFADLPPFFSVFSHQFLNNFFLVYCRYPHCKSQDCISSYKRI